MSSSDEPGKLFVGGLSWETTQENLQQYFCRFGEVVDSVVMKNNETGRSRGFGFVTFKDPDCLSIVLSSGPHELDGRTIDPKSCNPRGTTKVSEGKSSGSSFKQKRDNNLPKVFLGGLPSTCTETDIRNFFSKYGKVMEVVIMYDQEKKKSRGFGFLSFDTEEPIDRLCAEHYVNIGGKQVECKRAEPREASRGRRGNSGGGGSGGGYQGGGPMQNNQWSSGPNMMGGPPSWGSGPMGGGPAAPGGPPGGGPMPNGMMSGYQGGWGAPQQQQQQQGAYQGYGTNYQGWGTAAPTGYPGYGGTGTQYPQQQGYGNYGYGGYGTMPAVGGGQQPPSGGTGDPYAQQAAAPPGMQGAPAAQPQANSGTMGSYSQDSSSYGPTRGYGAASAGGDANNPYGTTNQGYGASGYNQVAAGGGAAAGGQAGRQPAAYHPYRR